MITIIPLLLFLLGIYLAIGFVFGILFAFAGAKSIDPSAADGTWGFKILIIPGCAIFWPYLLKRWLKKSPPPEEYSAHRRAAKS
ncbi:MAG: hypothetical protein O7C75_13420 [Verrucomicrobia bacterium]|nr:hypothetical protein [Verrucomicrobiota bacterium]